MYYSNMKSVDISKCILCHDAVCTKACPAMDPARIIRALRFDNAAGASMMLPKEDVCLHCDGKCQNVCPAEVPIQKLMSGLRKEFPEQKEIPGLDDVDLSCDICGVKLENPFMLSSSVVASNYEMTARAFEMGWSGAAFKTICLMDIREASPRFSTVKTGEGSFYGFKNIEQLSDYELEENLNFFRELKKNYPSKVILASIMGRNEEEWTYLAKVVTEAGADVIECNFSCPNMEAKNTGVDVGQDPETVKRYVQAVRRGTNIPILAKMTPNVADMRPAAKAAIEGGADGIAAINTIKSIINVDLDTFTTAPTVNGKSMVGGYSGVAVKPIALRFISDMYKDPAIRGHHISGMGGIETWRDGMEFIALGSSSLQVTTAVMLYGYRIIDDLLLGTKIYMAENGVKSISELIGRAVDGIVENDEIERDTIVYPKFYRDHCVGCGRCYIACRDGGHQALRFDEETHRPTLIPDKCVGCHLCALVCPEHAIRGDGKRMGKKKK